MRRTPNEELAAASRHGPPIVIATMPVSARQRNVIFGGLAILLAVVFLTIPFANIQLTRVDAFVPIIGTFMCVSDLLAAALLLGQYSVQPRFAVLVLASGYIFSGLFAFLQTLAFPQAYAPAGVIGDGLNSASWLFVLWHTAFPLSVIVYSLSKDADEPANLPRRSTGITIGITVACVAMATAGLTWVATAGVGYLPVMHEDIMKGTQAAQDAAVYLSLLNAAALVFLFIRRKTILDQWLIVTLLAWLPNLVIALFFPFVRFTVAWYASRVYALFAGSSLVFFLLAETMLLYIRLADAVILLQRERSFQSVLMNELDHRVKNVLARVTAVAEFTCQGSGSIKEFMRSYGGRIRSMATAHDLLSQTSWQGTDLTALIRKQLAPYAMDANITIAGTDIVLSASATQALAMVLHELVTNAAKHGALSIPGGRVSVSWECKLNGSAAANLILLWREVGGPPVASEIRSGGYGTGLISELIPHELGGNVDLVFASDGVYCRIEFPLEPASSDLRA